MFRMCKILAIFAILLNVDNLCFGISSTIPWHDDNLTTESTLTTNVSLIKEDYSDAEWLKYFNISQTTFTVLGLLLNLMTFVTFVKNGEMFSGVMRALLKHQAFADILVCLMGILVLAIPPMQVTFISI